MQTLNKDILTVEEGVICHQVNCKKAMGSGLALAIKNKWPVVEISYVDMCNIYPEDFTLLGKQQYVRVAPGLHVCNVFGQLNYGKGQRNTDYGALNVAFREIAVEASKNSYRHFYFPYKFGCDRGGGDWGIVSTMLEYYLPTAILCKI